MQLFILAVGKARGSAEQQLAKDWLERLPVAGSIHEIESKLPAGAKRTEDEGIRLCGRYRLVRRLLFLTHAARTILLKIWQH